MVSQVQHSVVILYKHALLGEGIAEHLRAQLGVEAMIGSEDDPEAVMSTLGLGPAVVIFELGDTLRQFDLPTLPPAGRADRCEHGRDPGPGHLIRGRGDGADPPGRP